jgi:LPS export ABC transporter protein LptC
MKVKATRAPLHTPYSLLPILCSLFFVSCTFDYGSTESNNENQPDLIMENLDYVRVRAADPLARFQAVRAERYERQGVMRIQELTFEQYGERGEEINASGKVGYASVDIGSGDIYMDEGVRIEVDAEDLIIETNQLSWKDEPRLLSTSDDERVNIYQEKGTNFTGTGLNADARRRTWEFVGEVGGIFVQEDEVIEEETDGYQYEE